MAIARFSENTRLPVIGKIRLGIRKESQKGIEYPESVPHFVLHDAPEIIKVYGETPTEIDGFFLTDDIDEAIPNWYKWYAGGKRDKSGNIVGGELLCYGTGPAALNKDGTVVPGEAWHLKNRDPITRAVPVRQCLGEKCPDFFGSNGKPQCGPSMTVNLFVPLASMFGIFSIDTKSVTSIQRFVSQVSLIKEQFGRLKGIPFKIYRDPVSMPVPDKPGTRKTHYILSIKPNEEFLEKHGAAVKAKIASIVQGNFMGPAASDMIEAPMEDNYAITHDEYKPIEQKVEVAKEIGEDPELAPLFEQLSALTKAANTSHNRSLAARKFEKEADPKEALKKYLQSRIAQYAPKEEPAQPPFQNQEKSQPQPNAEGLI